MIHRQIHILRDPWIPLDQNGQEELASVVELLTGSKDAPDLLHPRDDYRFFARMLLSSLVQALFEPENEAEIEARIAHPMSLREVEDRIAEVEDDFWLVHPEPRKGFLQTAKAVEKKDKAEGLSVDALDSLAESHLLYRRLSRRPAVCATCAVCALYGLQATARSAGSGFVPSIRGGAPMSTLLSLGADKDRSVRADVWVNVLARTVLPRFELTRSTGNPWVQKARSVPRKPHRFMVAEGLLWQPRALRMVAHEQGTCSSCGRRMEILFAASGVHPGVESVQGESAFFAHPYCPTVKPGKHLSTPGNTPFWCSIGEVLPGLTNERNDKGDAAPVVLHQVATDRTHGLLLLEIASNNAKILHVIHESLGLPRQLRIDYRAT